MGLTSFVTDSLKGLLIKLARKSGIEELNAVFESLVPDYFTEVYKEIEKITKQVVEKNTIAEINGELSTFTLWMENVYDLRKDETNVTKEELRDLLEPKVSYLAIHMIGILQDEAFAESALGVFVIAASLHLLLLDELARVDPLVEDPANSMYKASIKKYAKNYADHVGTTFELVKNKRESLVDRSSLVFMIPLPIPLGFLRWSDKITGTSDTIVTCTFSIMLGYVDKVVKQNINRNKHILKVIEELDPLLNQPSQTANSWRILAGEPISENENAARIYKTTDQYAEVLKNHFLGALSESASNQTYFVGFTGGGGSL